MTDVRSWRAMAGAPDAAVPAAAASTPTKLVVVFMENHGLADITSAAGAAAMPYLNSLWNDPASEQFQCSDAVGPSPS
ncbi:MAG: hypothetical protein ACLP7J_19395 [Streptosporangiaceae bacterium]